MQRLYSLEQESPYSKIGGNQPHQINVNIVVTIQQSNINMQIHIDPEIPFNIFIQGIKEQIFAQRMQSQYEDTIEYQLGEDITIDPQTNTNLRDLGFVTDCKLIVILNLKGGGGLALLHLKKLKIFVKIPLIFEVHGKKFKLKNNMFTFNFNRKTPFCFIIFRIIEEMIGNVDQQLCKNLDFRFSSGLKIFPLDNRNFFDIQRERGCLSYSLIVTISITISIIIFIRHKIIEYEQQQSFQDSFSLVFEQIKRKCYSFTNNFKNLGKFYFLLDNKKMINNNENKTLSDLGFLDGSVLQCKCYFDEEVN